MNNKAKNFDQSLKFVFYFFLLLAFWAISAAIYDKIMSFSNSLQLAPTFTFLFFAFFSKYYYTFIYWSKQVEQMKNEEQQLHRNDQDQNNLN